MSAPQQEMAATRVVEETQHGVVLYPPTTAKPYFRIVFYDENGQRKQRNAGKDHAAAQAKAFQIDDELAKKFADPTGRLVQEMCAEWLEAMQPHWSDSEEHYNRSLREAVEHIVPYIGTISAAHLDRQAVKDLLAVPTSVSGKRHLRNAVGAMLTWGYANEWTPNSRDYYLPKPPRTSKRGAGRQHGESHQFIEPRLRPDAESCGKLADAAAQLAGKRHAEKLWLMVAVSASAGPREGELWAAPPSNFNLDTFELYVDRQVVRPKGKGAIETLPKWGRVRHTVLLDDTIWGEPMLPRLADYLEQMKGEKLAFPAARGGYVHPSNFARDILDDAREKVGGMWAKGDKGWTWHSLRHAFCTWMLANGRAPADVSNAAGHRDGGVTLAMYVGTTKGTTDRLRNGPQQ